MATDGRGLGDAHPTPLLYLMYTSSRTRRQIMLAILALTVILAGVCVTTAALAQTPLTIKLKIIPKGRFIDLDHDRYRAYTLGEFKLLAAADQELYDRRLDAAAYEKIVLQGDVIDEQLSHMITSCEGDLGLLVSQDERTNQLLREQVTRNEGLLIENKWLWKAVVATGVAAAVALAALFAGG